jgi:hypothetical protein
MNKSLPPATTSSLRERLTQDITISQDITIRWYCRRWRSWRRCRHRHEIRWHPCGDRPVPAAVGAATCRPR